MSQSTSALTRLKDHLDTAGADAKALPGIAYTEASILQREIDTIFHGDWVLACMAADVATAGDYHAFDLAGEPILIIRGDDGELRALSNVCRHRGTPLVEEGQGNAGRLICPYHAWTYANTGALKAVPHPGSVEIDKSCHGLHDLGIGIWNGLVFVSLNKGSVDLHTYLAGIAPLINAFDLGRYVHPHPGEVEHWGCNWKIAMENAAESYHLFKVHRQTLETITPTKGARYLQGNSRWSVTEGTMQASSGWFDWLSADHGPKARYWLIAIPPGFVAILSHDALAWLNVRPTGPETCRVESGALSPHKEADSRENAEFVQAFLAEDKAICEQVQAGMKSRFAGGGPLVELEQILADFQAYLREHLFGTTA